MDQRLTLTENRVSTIIAAQRGVTPLQPRTYGAPAEFENNYKSSGYDTQQNYLSQRNYEEHQYSSSNTNYVQHEIDNTVSKEIDMSMQEEVKDNQLDYSNEEIITVPFNNRDDNDDEDYVDDEDDI